MDLNRSFLRGERHRTIYHEGPPNDETRVMISGLLRLHDYGMLAHGSKPNDGEPPVSVATWWIQTGQRSYVEFLIPRGDRITRENVNLFCRLLVQHPKIVTLIDHNCEGLEPEMPESYALTRERVALTHEAVYMESWKDIKWLRLNQHDIMRQYGMDVWEKCLGITVVAKCWIEQVDLLQLIEGTAMAAGIERLYAEAE